MTDRFDDLISMLTGRPMPDIKKYNGGPLPVGAILRSPWSDMQVEILEITLVESGKNKGEIKEFSVMEVNSREKFSFQQKDLFRWRIIR